MQFTQLSMLSKKEWGSGGFEVVWLTCEQQLGLAALEKVGVHDQIALSIV